MRIVAEITVDVRNCHADVVSVEFLGWPERSGVRRVPRAAVMKDSDTQKQATNATHQDSPPPETSRIQFAASDHLCNKMEFPKQRSPMAARSTARGVTGVTLRPAQPARRIRGCTPIPSRPWQHSDPSEQKCHLLAAPSCLYWSLESRPRPMSLSLGWLA